MVSASEMPGEVQLVDGLRDGGSHLDGHEGGPRDDLVSVDAVEQRLTAAMWRMQKKQTHL